MIGGGVKIFYHPFVLLTGEAAEEVREMKETEVI